MPTHLNRLYGDLRAAGRAPKTIRNIHGVLSKALADAEPWGLVGRNAARLADVPAVARPKLRVWSPEQTRAFLAAVANDRLFAAWLLAATHRHAPQRAARPSLERTSRTAAWPSPCRAARPSTRTDSACGFGAMSGRLSCLPSGCTTWVTPTSPPDSQQAYPKVMSERLGHASVAFTLDTYTSALPVMDKSAADVVARRRGSRGLKSGQMTMASPTNGNRRNAMVGFCPGQTTRPFRV
jgi:hypothetical protein